MVVAPETLWPPWCGSLWPKKCIACVYDTNYNSCHLLALLLSWRARWWRHPTCFFCWCLLCVETPHSNNIVSMTRNQQFLWKLQTTHPTTTWNNSNINKQEILQLKLQSSCASHYFAQGNTLHYAHTWHINAVVFGTARHERPHLHYSIAATSHHFVVIKLHTSHFMIRMGNNRDFTLEQRISNEICQETNLLQVINLACRIVRPRYNLILIKLNATNSIRVTYTT